MNKEEFRQELDKHGLDINYFLDLRDAWSRLKAEEKIELLREGNKND